MTMIKNNVIITIIIATHCSEPKCELLSIQNNRDVQIQRNLILLFLPAAILVPDKIAVIACCNSKEWLSLSAPIILNISDTGYRLDVVLVVVEKSFIFIAIPITKSNIHYNMYKCI